MTLQKTTTVNTLVDMLEYKRSHGTKSHIKFLERYLLPVFGQPDEDGNFVKIIGDKPRVAWMSHHDSVHRSDGMQKIMVMRGYAEDKFVKSKSAAKKLTYGSTFWRGISAGFTDSVYKTVKVQSAYLHAQLHRSNRKECLGADCATGMWLMLCMIEAGVEGVYVIHAEEETGCNGSRKLVARKPDWLQHIDAAISFDRKGYESIITHQTGQRTCSDAFANSLSDAIGLEMSCDSGGSYTDSNEYKYVVPECTNVSVGYFNQHTSMERQDLDFAEMLRQNLCSGSFDALTIERDPEAFDVWPSYTGGGRYGPYNATMSDLVYDYHNEIAEFLEQCGYTVDEMQREIMKLNPRAGEEDEEEDGQRHPHGYYGYDYEQAYYDEYKDAWEPTGSKK